jgi:hypothetical protein
MPYSNRYTWAKYGHFILHAGIIPIDNTAAGSDDKSLPNQNKKEWADHNDSLTVNHCDCLISFLRTDPDGAASFIVDASSTCSIDQFLNNTFQSLTKGTKKGYFFDELIEKNAGLTVSSICVIAKEATKIPLAIFTDLFHHRFKTKIYLESTLELLQQFYIKLVNHSETFRIWVGDLHKYCLHCTRCHRAITRPDYIHCIMEIAPMAMLWHMGMASDVSDYCHCPLILPYREAMFYSCSQFEDSREKIDDKIPSPFLKCNATTNQGMLRFCEATKGDLQSSFISKFNQNKTHDSTIKNTISLVLSLFVDMIDVDMAV